MLRSTFTAPVIMSPALFKFRITAALALGLSAFLPASSSAADLALQGCWRSQHFQVSYPGMAARHQNADCVTTFNSVQQTMVCRSGNVTTESVYDYRVDKPGRMQAKMVSTSSGMPLMPPFEANYRINGEWLTITRDYNAGSEVKPGAVTANKFTSLLVRVTERDGAAACQPRGDTGIRIDKGPFSSLALRVPAGWRPLLLDPESPQVRDSIGTNFFIGAFSKRNLSAESAIQAVMLFEDTRYGPVAVRAAQFEGIKRRFFSELGNGRQACDLVDRACAFLSDGAANVTYSELFNVRGRVAMVIVAATDAAPAVEKEMVDTARLFTAMLQENNPSGADAATLPPATDK